MYWKVWSHGEGNPSLFTPARCEKHCPRNSLLSTSWVLLGFVFDICFLFGVCFFFCCHEKGAPEDSEPFTAAELEAEDSVSSFSEMSKKRGIVFCGRRWETELRSDKRASLRHRPRPTVLSFRQSASTNSSKSLKKEPDATKVMKVRLLERLAIFPLVFFLPLPVSRLSFCHILGFFQKSTVKAVEPSARFWAPPTVWLNLRKTVVV